MRRAALLLSLLLVSACSAGPPLLPRYEQTGACDTVGVLSTAFLHHEDAVLAARDLLSWSADVEVVRFAERIVRVQTGEMEVMRGWGAERRFGFWRPMFRTMARDERDFLVRMVAHHEEMLRFYADVAGCVPVEVGVLLGRIAKGQVGEVRRMSEMLHRRGVGVPPGGSGFICYI